MRSFRSLVDVCVFFCFVFFTTHLTMKSFNVNNLMLNYGLTCKITSNILRRRLAVYIFPHSKYLRRFFSDLVPNITIFFFIVTVIYELGRKSDSLLDNSSMRVYLTFLENKHILFSTCL